MSRLVAPNGAIVNVSDEKAKRLLVQDFKLADAKKAPAKKATSSKTEK